MGEKKVKSVHAANHLCPIGYDHVSDIRYLEFMPCHVRSWVSGRGRALAGSRVKELAVQGPIFSRFSLFLFILRRYEAKGTRKVNLRHALEKSGIGKPLGLGNPSSVLVSFSRSMDENQKSIPRPCLHLETHECG